MANALQVGAIADAAVATLYERLGVTNLMHRDFSQALVTAKRGDTMNVRKPATFEAKSFTHAAGIQVQDITETTVPVRLDKIDDVSFSLTDTELTMSVDEFTERFVSGAIEALAQKVDRAAIAHMVTATSAAVGVVDAAGGPAKAHAYGDHKVLIDAGYVLNRKNVPLVGRNALVGPGMEAMWREKDSVQHADKSGDTQALRQGSIGQNLHGFDAFWTQNVAAPKAVADQATGDPTTEIGVAFHKDAFTFTNASLVVPAGAHAAVQNFNGLSLRVIQAYDASHKQSTFSVDVLYGISTLDANKAVLIKGADKGNG